MPCSQNARPKLRYRFLSEIEYITKAILMRAGRNMKWRVNVFEVFDGEMSWSVTSAGAGGWRESFYLSSIIQAGRTARRPPTVVGRRPNVPAIVVSCPYYLDFALLLFRCLFCGL